MKYILMPLVTFICLCEYASACPDVSGTFDFTNEPWNGSIHVEQKGCASITITHSRKVAASARFPDGQWIETKTLKTNGRAYVGFKDSSQRADAKTPSFQKVSWENQRLVIRHYAGSIKACGDKYYFYRSQCHVTEYTLSREPFDEFAWSQTGLWFEEGESFRSDTYALMRRQPIRFQFASVGKLLKILN